MKNIIFVCKKNSRRSQIREGSACVLGDGRVGVTKDAGLESSQVDPTTAKVMSEVGINISNRASKPLSKFNSYDYNAVISLSGCGVKLPGEWVVRDVFEDWQLDNPEGQSIETFRRVRDELKERVATLVTQLESTSKP